MIDINKLAVDFYDELEIKAKVDMDVLQVLAEHTLYNVPQSSLKFPRLIHGITSYNESDYDNKTDWEYDSDDDKLKSTVEVIPRVVYRFKIYADGDSAGGLFDLINKIHDYYSNRYIQHLNGSIEVVDTSSITPLLIDENEQATVGWTFTIDFDTSSLYIAESDYAIEANSTLTAITD